MNTKKLFIHIGTHKTGSTAIQHALNKHTMSLQKEGIVYIQPSNTLLKLMASTKLDNNLINKCKSELSHAFNYNNNKKSSLYLMSWEGFSGVPSSGYDNASVIAESLRGITLGLDVYIIVYLRRQDDFIESLYTQKIHEGESYSFETFIKKFPSSAFNWKRLLDCYSNIFGKEKLIVRRYGRDFLPERNSLLNDFASIIGSSCLVTNINTSTPNSGYSRDALEIARLTNPSLNSAEQIQLRQILQKANSKLPFESYSFFNKNDRKKNS